MREDFAGRHLGKRCFVLGGGPSLADMDLSALRDELTFSCNRGHLLFSRMGFPTTYWAVEDSLDASQFRHEFEQLRGPVKFGAQDLRLGGDVIPVPFDREPYGAEGPVFARQPPFACGWTVSYFMLQLAAYMGCNPIYLLGQDFTWDESKVSPNRAGDLWVVGAGDTNHFDPNYWPAGTRQFPPNVTKMRQAFHAARQAGVPRIINITPGSRLDVFERDTYANVVARGVEDAGPPHFRMHQHPAEIDAFAAFARARRPVNVLEIGVLQGGTAELWHSLCSGLVIGVDRKQEPLGMAARFPRYRHVERDSHVPEAMVDVCRLLGNEKLDLLFIDGDHSFDGVSRDYEDYRHLVRPGGLIAFHDINASAQFFEPWENGGVPRFWWLLNSLISQPIPEGNKIEFSIHDVWGGIGVLQV